MKNERSCFITVDNVDLERPWRSTPDLKHACQHVDGEGRMLLVIPRLLVHTATVCVCYVFVQRHVTHSTLDSVATACVCQYNSGEKSRFDVEIDSCAQSSRLKVSGEGSRYRYSSRSCFTTTFKLHSTSISLHRG